MKHAELTFVFTDIEGSTRLVRALADDYARVLRESRRLIESSFCAEGGRIVERSGDGVFAVFDRSSSAVAAALAAQRAIFHHEWGEADVRVRMGIHAGRAMRDRGDLVGVDIHRASRIAAAAHGGQVVVSEQAAALAEAEVRWLGEYELAGLPEPEPLFQLIAPDLPSEFPPLRAARRRDAKPVRVVVADDSILIREGVASVLTEAGFEVVAKVGSAGELLHCVRRYEPDLAVVDIRMPPRRTDDGLRAALVMRRRMPAVGILLVSELMEPPFALELVEAGAEGVGYLLKERVADADEFAATARRIADGEAALDATLVADLFRRRECEALQALAPSEREVLGLVAQGLSDQVIAQRLFLPLADAEDAVASTLAKIGLDPAADPSRRTVELLVALARSYFAAVA